MIKRIFSVVVYPELQEEFEDKFHNLALPDTLSSHGCLSVEISKPTSCNPNTYLMVSEWESVKAAYFGESERSFRFYPITFSSSFSSLPVLP